MADSLSWTGFAVRLFFALTLVFCTYNPEGYSFYHWGILNIQADLPLKLFVGVVLLIGWTIYIRATLHSLGFIGIALAVAFFGSLTWVVIDLGWIPTNSVKALTYVVQLIISWILTTGISWSFIRKKISGQYDVVEGEEAEH
ncbi:MAG: DUF6524 family protein [Gammaproteobacteria bacterium]|nr:DUF6524 family protein [Gammaproteobacteria bacterium]MDH5802626.1 DUF6524 family protein [Gammaproteobacteria bacterium]